MGVNRLKDFLADKWLAQVPSFCSSLVDTGERYQGNPIFLIEYRFADFATIVPVYRYTPLNSQHSVLAFVPEEK